MHAKPSATLCCLFGLVVFAASCSASEDTPASGYTPGDAAAETAADASADVSAEASPDAVWPETGPQPDGPTEHDAPAVNDVQPEPPVPLTAEEICDVANPNLLETVRNGSEICDDQAFSVPDPYVPMVIACFAGGNGNGVGYIAGNTGPECTQDQGCCESQIDCPTQDRLANEGNTRCQGFEWCGCAGQICPCSDAWDHLQYVSDPAGEIRIDCPPGGIVRDIDLSAYAGQTLWVGSHTKPDYSGRMTETCVALKN